MRKNSLVTLLSLVIMINISVPIYATTTLSDDKNKFSEVSTEAKKLDTEISDLNEEIASIKQTISNNESEISTVELEISKSNSRIIDLQSEIESNETLLSARLREIYKSGTGYATDIVVFLLNSDSISDLTDRITAAKTLVELDNKVIQENKDISSELEDSKKTIEDKKETLVTLNNDVKTNLEQVSSKQKEMLDSKAKLETEMKSLNSSIAENEEKLVSHEIAIINSSSPSSDELTNAISTLSELKDQISTPSVLKKVNDAITLAKEKLAKLSKESAMAAKNSNSSESTSESAKSPIYQGAEKYKKTFTMEATAYTGHTFTTLGLKPVRNPSGLSSVAVDPNIIPLGSKVYISNYGYAIASDTGSAIKGNIIDLFMNSKEECTAFGRQTVTVNIIAYPGEW